jgi:hypothetical protein
MRTALLALVMILIPATAALNAPAGQTFGAAGDFVSPCAALPGRLAADTGDSAAELSIPGSVKGRHLGWNRVAVAVATAVQPDSDWAPMETR